MTRALFVVLALLMLLPQASPGLALALGTAFALTLGNPWPAGSARLAKLLLQASVVGLGFGMSLGAVWKAGSSGIAFVVAGIAVTLILGMLLGRWLRVQRDASLLIAAGTGICGGSAIAAVGPAIGASVEAMSVSLATVFLLNGVALYLFPPIGHLLQLSQSQFAIWAAVAIHDTSSVVGAAAAYGPAALASATVLKLSRALWIVPLTVAAAAYVRRDDRTAANDREAAPGEDGGEHAEPRPKLKMPWFIAWFVVAALLRTILPTAATPTLDLLAHAAKVGLVVTLFFIGAGLTRATLRSVGVRPLVQGVLLWLTMASLSLWVIWRWVPA